MMGEGTHNKWLLLLLLLLPVPAQLNAAPPLTSGQCVAGWWAHRCLLLLLRAVRMFPLFDHLGNLLKNLLGHPFLMIRRGDHPSMRIRVEFCSRGQGNSVCVAGGGEQVQPSHVRHAHTVAFLVAARPQAGGMRATL